LFSHLIDAIRRENVIKRFPENSLFPRVIASQDKTPPTLFLSQKVSFLPENLHNAKRVTIEMMWGETAAQV